MPLFWTIQKMTTLIDCYLWLESTAAACSDRVERASNSGFGDLDRLDPIL
jgi:hypothetical protein